MGGGACVCAFLMVARMEPRPPQPPRPGGRAGGGIAGARVMQTRGGGGGGVVRGGGERRGSWPLKEKRDLPEGEKKRFRNGLSVGVCFLDADLASLSCFFLVGWGVGKEGWKGVGGGGGGRGGPSRRAASFLDPPSHTAPPPFPPRAR